MQRKLLCALSFCITLSPVALLAEAPGGIRSEACRALSDLRIDDTNLLSAVVVPATDDLPEYCRVLGYVRPAINFEIRLPTSDWNDKLFMAGCGVFCGKVESDNTRINAINIGLKRNYAVSTTDTGHWGESMTDGTWAYHNRQAEIDFGYRGVHETARVTKAVIEAYYGRSPVHSYFQGCSTGGRQANMAAWRYPEDFDGIVSGCPDLDRAGQTTYAAWLAAANHGSTGKNLITSVEAALVKNAVYDACDGLDGLEDGLISDPPACTFDPAILMCASSDQANCLTPEQVEALGAFYETPKNSDGDRLYSEGVPFGSEPYWDLWITGDGSSDFALTPIGTNYLRYLAFEEDPGDSYSILDFDFDRDPARLEHMAQFYSSDNPDLGGFRRNGGKLLMWHSWADAAILPLRTIEYYNAVERLVGSRESTQEFLRLFMIPGMDHCGILDGPGINDGGFDPLTALERWVEQGEAPASLLSTKTDSTGRVLWTRPLCPYPDRAVYRGTGDVNDASNFDCVTP